MAGFKKVTQCDALWGISASALFCNAKWLLTPDYFIVAGQTNIKIVVRVADLITLRSES